MTAIPPVEVRQVRPCSDCANFRPDDEHWHSCVLDKGENRGPERHPEHLYHDRWGLDESQLSDWICTLHFTPEEMIEIITRYNNIEAFSSMEHNAGEQQKTWGASEIADLIAEENRQQSPEQQ